MDKDVCLAVIHLTRELHSHRAGGDGKGLTDEEYITYNANLRLCTGICAFFEEFYVQRLAQLKEKGLPKDDAQGNS